MSVLSRLLIEQARDWNIPGLRHISPTHTVLQPPPGYKPPRVTPVETPAQIRAANELIRRQRYRQMAKQIDRLKYPSLMKTSYQGTSTSRGRTEI